MEIIDRIVDFGEYCATCKYENTKEADEPCRECLENPTNIYTDKPIKWVEDEKKKVETDEEES